MGQQVRLTAEDGHQLQAYSCVPRVEAKGGLVVLQEIFGVNSHIRSVVDRFCGEGWLVIAPALFDRVETGVELGYAGEDLERAFRLSHRLKLQNALTDVRAAIAWVRDCIGDKRAGVVGYCYGGTLAWLSATRLGSDSAVCYYGGHIARYAEETPRCPVMMHFGTKDRHISKADIDHIEQLHPEVQLYRYDAGHGFNCEARADFSPLASANAFERTLAFLGEHLVEQQNHECPPNP